MKQLLNNINKTDIRNIIAVMYNLLALVFIYVLACKAVPAENKDLINVLGGSVFGGLCMIISFYFGSSKNDTNNNA